MRSAMRNGGPALHSHPHSSNLKCWSDEKIIVAPDLSELHSRRPKSGGCRGQPSPKPVSHPARSANTSKSDHLDHITAAKLPPTPLASYVAGCPSALIDT